MLTLQLSNEAAPAKIAQLRYQNVNCRVNMRAVRNHEVAVVDLRASLPQHHGFALVPMLLPNIVALRRSVPPTWSIAPVLRRKSWKRFHQDARCIGRASAGPAALGTVDCVVVKRDVAGAIEHGHGA